MQEEHLAALIDQWLHGLKAQHRAVLELSFGLNGAAASMLGEIAGRFHLTPEGMRQMHREALQQLRYGARRPRLQLDGFL